MNESELLPLDTYAQVLAHLLHRGATPIATIFGRFQLSAEAFRRADEQWTEELAHSVARRKGKLAMTFAAAFAQSHKELGTIDASAGDPNVAVAPSHPSALPSYLRNQAAATPAPVPIAQPTAASPVSRWAGNPESPPRQASVPFANVAVPPVAISSAPSPVNIDATAEVRVISRAPALPFSGTTHASGALSAASEEPRPLAHRPVGDETAALPAIEALKVALPFGSAGASAGHAPTPVQDLPVDPTKLTLEQYASLSAELATMHEPRPAVLGRYGLHDENARTEHALYWARRMQKNESLKTRYTDLVASYREHLERSRGG